MKGKLIGFAIALLSVATIGVIQLDANAADSTRDCDRYAIVYCGTMTEQEARSKYNNGDNAAVFRSFGISQNEISGMKQGIVYRDGTVRVGSRVVARNAQTAIRNVNGTNIPGSSTAKRVPVSRMADAQTAMVKFDRNGKFMFAIMKPCGNPVTGTPTPPPAQPSAACKSLSVTKLERTKFRFNAQATVKDGAKVRGYTFQVTKNGKVIDTKRVNSTKLSATYAYTQTKAGSYKVRLTAHTSEGNKSGSNCIKEFTVKETPKKPSIEVTKLVEGVKYTRVNVDVEYDYQLAVTNTGNKDLKNVLVTDTPENGVTLVSAENGTITDNIWTYTIPTLKQGETQKFTLTGKVPEYLAGRINNTVCVDTPDIPGKPDDCDDAEVDVPTPEDVVVCNPDTGEIITVSKADEDNYVPVDSPECEEAETTPPAPEELPETGASEQFMQLIGMTSLVGASAYYLRSGRL